MSTDTVPQFNRSKLGQWSDPVEFAVTRERIQEYAAATNDTIAPHAAGDIAPPVFAIVPAFQALAPALGEVTPPELIMMTVHGEQDFRFHAPIRPDTELTSTPSPTSARRSGWSLVPGTSDSARHPTDGVEANPRTALAVERVPARRAV